MKHIKTFNEKSTQPGYEKGQPGYQKGQRGYEKSTPAYMNEYEEEVDDGWKATIDMEELQQLLTMLSEVDFNEENINLHDWGYTKQNLIDFAELLKTKI